MKKHLEHCKELSCYNNNIYKLLEPYAGATHVYDQCCELSSVNCFAFGIVEEGRFVQTTPNLFLNFQGETDFGDFKLFECGEMSILEAIEKYGSDHSFLY